MQSLKGDININWCAVLSAEAGGNKKESAHVPFIDNVGLFIFIKNCIELYPYTCMYSFVSLLNIG